MLRRRDYASLENMGIWEEGEEKRLIKRCSLVSGGIVSQRSLLCHTGVIGETWHEGLPLIPAIRVGTEPLCAVTQHSIGAEGAEPGPGPN